MSLSVSFKSNSVVEPQKTEKINPKVSSFGGSVAALTAGALVHQAAPYPIAKTVLDKFVKVGTFNPEEGKVVHDAVKQMLVDTGLKDKGVRIKFLNPKVKKIKDSDMMEKFYKTFYDMLYVNPVRRGKNAFFSPKDLKLPKKMDFMKFTELSQKGDKDALDAMMKEIKKGGIYIKKNSVVLPQNKIQGAGFHELGHAMNCNLSKFGKFLQHLRPVALFAPIVLGIYCAVTKKSKPAVEGGELNKKQKVNNFLRDNAGKLTFAAAVPMLLEEGMATIKGQKFANKLLKSDLAKKVLKSNSIAYLSYLLVATAGALAVRTAVKIKDNAIAKKEAKAIAKANAQAQAA